MWDDRPQLRKSKPRILPEFWCARFTPGSSGWETVAHLQVGKLSSFCCEDVQQNTLQVGNLEMWKYTKNDRISNRIISQGMYNEQYEQCTSMNLTYNGCKANTSVLLFCQKFPGTTTCLLCCALWKQLVDLGWGTEWGHLNGPWVSREGASQPVGSQFLLCFHTWHDAKGETFWSSGCWVFFWSQKSTGNLWHQVKHSYIETLKTQYAAAMWCKTSQTTLGLLWFRADLQIGFLEFEKLCDVEAFGSWFNDLVSPVTGPSNDQIVSASVSVSVTPRNPTWPKWRIRHFARRYINSFMMVLP